MLCFQSACNYCKGVGISIEDRIGFKRCPTLKQLQGIFLPAVRVPGNQDCLSDTKASRFQSDAGDCLVLPWNPNLGNARERPIKWPLNAILAIGILFSGCRSSPYSACKWSAITSPFRGVQRSLQFCFLVPTGRHSPQGKFLWTNFHQPRACFSIAPTCGGSWSFLK